MMDKVNWFKLMLIAVMIGLLGRLVTLQIIEGKYYRALAEENRISLKIIPADRGIFYDRYGEVLVRNTPAGREYVAGKALASVLGYVGEISREELENCRQKNDCAYVLGDVVGKMGLEKQYDKLLRGKDGGVLIETDAEGQVVREIGRRQPEAGRSLKLSLDLGLQREAEKLMSGRRGAVVASDPETGEILAMVSSPSFDPAKVKEYVDDKDLPLFNRAIGGEYPPGSVFKVITAIAALEEGKVDETTTVEDKGEIKVGRFRYGNWYFDQYGKTEGVINLVRAIARSNDIFFYKLGEWLGALKLADWSKYFGLGVISGIDLPGEANGLVPTPEWKKAYLGENWYLGDTYITAIGQGNILVTPLQINQMMAVIASRGRYCRPHLLVQDEVRCRKLDISSNSVSLVIEGLKQVTETGGTAFPFFNFKVKGKPIELAGKTGTAEYGAKDSQKTHAWFSGFAPVNKPQISLTVLLEGAGEGSRQAAPVAKQLLEYWFSRKE